MRGGRNKFGSMYKRDRAARLQAQRISERYSTIGEHMVTSSTQNNSDMNVFAHPSAMDALYLRGDNGKHAQSSHGHKPAYESHVQSPTLSSSTHSPPQRPLTIAEPQSILASPFGAPSNNGLHSASAYIPNCDSLSALLSGGLDDPLRSHAPTAFYSFGDPLRLIKPEPFEYDPFASTFGSLNGDYSSSYGNNASGDPTLGFVGMGSFTAGFRDFDINASSAGSMLPICPIPTSKTFQMNFTASHNHISQSNNLSSAPNQTMGNGGSAFKTNGSHHPSSSVSALGPLIKPGPTSPNHHGKPNEFLMNLARELFSFEDGWRREFVDQVQKLTGDNFTVICHAIDRELHREVAWAKNNAYFCALQVIIFNLIWWRPSLWWSWPSFRWTIKCNCWKRAGPSFTF